MTKRRIIENLRDRGLTYKEIVAETGLSKSTVAWHLSEKARKLSLEARGRNKRKFIRELKLKHGGRFTLCGYDRCLNALQFHHRDPATKHKFRRKNGVLIGLTSASRFFSQQKIEDEAKKCDLVCANCHAELHEKQ